MKYIKYLILISLISILIYIPTYDKEETIKISDIKPIITKSKEEKILETMTIEEKVGQLFIYGFDGTELNKNNRKILEGYNLGGVIIYSKNISNQKQLKKLIKDIQSINDIPLFISIDQEGGIVSRLIDNRALTIGQNEIDSTKEAYAVAKSRGTILKDLGINMNLAPVIEYITSKDSFIYSRVYRGSLEDVYSKSISSIEGYTDSGIISVPKHYPGHSNTNIDPHKDLPSVNISKDNWNEYIKPFSMVLNHTNVDALMVGHIKYPKIDKYPSTISNEIINNRLINDLKYEGLVISDDMEMDALDNIDTYTNIAKRALEAGNDILIYSSYTSKNKDMQKNVYEYILKEVKDNDINIDNKVLKILRIKIKYNIL